MNWRVNTINKIIIIKNKFHYFIFNLSFYSISDIKITLHLKMIVMVIVSKLSNENLFCLLIK